MLYDRWRGRPACNIAKVYGDGTYDIRYDDGDYEEHALIHSTRTPCGATDAAALNKPKRSTAGSTAADLRRQSLRRRAESFFLLLLARDTRCGGCVPNGPPERAATPRAVFGSALLPLTIRPRIDRSRPAMKWGRR